MKRLYVHRRDAVKKALDRRIAVDAMAGLAVLIRLPPQVDDRDLVRRAAAVSLAPVALSLWYSHPDEHHTGLLLGITNIGEEKLPEHCAELEELIGLSSR
jgi:GntR family transcriptional regulator/MocR family aminotransferase